MRQFIYCYGSILFEAKNSGLALSGKTKVDFVDCLLIARNRVLGEEVLTFDKKMARCKLKWPLLTGRPCLGT